MQRTTPRSAAPDLRGALLGDGLRLLLRTLRRLELRDGRLHRRPRLVQPRALLGGGALLGARLLLGAPVQKSTLTN